MLRLAALLFSTYVGAFVLTSAVAAPHELRAAWTRLAGGLETLVSMRVAGDAHADSLRASRASVRKAPALARSFVEPREPRSSDPVASEIVLLDGGALAILDAEGRVLLRHDPAGRTTTIARGADLPRLLATPAGDAPRPPEPSRRAPGDPGSTDEPDEALAAGCESPVGPLARGGGAASARALCLASL
ncbi:hypothetical protein [Salinarimonas chemoclinalis]|uniref:hypothetical protein n=1 Tax=Salinarimonas chemoclinalis TaxID=3241599 RepID=UPI0035584588